VVLPAPLLESLAAMPSELERLMRLAPRERWSWEPASWDGIPGERFGLLGQACHLRDIEIDGYQLRFRRLLEEEEPDLASIDSYALAKQREYATADLDDALARFRHARLETLETLRRVSVEQLARRGKFAEYGRVTFAGLAHYLGSHDQQHLACVQWLLGRLASA